MLILIATHVYLGERKNFSDKEKKEKGGRGQRQWVRGRKRKSGGEKKKRLQENTDEQSKFSRMA